MNRVLKKILIIVSIPVGIFLVWWAIEVGYSVWGNYKWKKQTAIFMNKLEQPFKEDTYGGKTPEETWGMFLDALKKGDVDLASKYYDVNHQEKGKTDLEQLRTEGSLYQFISDSETLEKNKTQPSSDRVYYSYKYFNVEVKKSLWSPVVFYLNPYTKIWKIVY